MKVHALWLSGAIFGVSSSLTPVIFNTIAAKWINLVLRESAIKIHSFVIANRIYCVFYAALYSQP